MIKYLHNICVSISFVNFCNLGVIQLIWQEYGPQWLQQTVPLYD